MNKRKPLFIAIVCIFIASLIMMNSSCNIEFEIKSSNGEDEIKSSNGEDEIKNHDVEYENKSTSVGLEFNLVKKEYAVAGLGTCKDTSIIIPSTYNDLPVTQVAEEAFFDCDSITSVKIPNTVTTIGANAFYACTSLTTIEIPDSITSIESGAFFACVMLNSISIPEKITEIKACTFMYCASLTSIEIPDSVTSIGVSAFYNCTSLTSIKMSNNVNFIGSYAFEKCFKLTYNEYDNACYLGNNLNQYLVLIHAKDTDIISCEINSDTKLIYDNAFYACSSLENIIIPKSVETIGAYAFGECILLEEVFFENTNGWYFIKSEQTSKNNIPSSNLSIPSVAASYLADLYSSYCWQCR